MRREKAFIITLLAAFILLPAIGLAQKAPPPFAFNTNPALLLPKGCSNGQGASFTSATNRWDCATFSGTLSGGTQYYLPYWTAADTLGKLASLGSSGSLLKSAGSGAAPAWTTETFAAPGATGAVLYSDGTNWTRSATPSLTALTISGANSLGLGTQSANTGSVNFKNSANNNQFILQAGETAATITYTLPAAAPTANGAVLTGATDGTLAFTVNPTLSTLNLYGANSLSLGTGSTNAGSVAFKNATNNNAFTITSGVSGAAIGWTLPTAAPGGANYLLNVDADGTMGYTDPASLTGAATAINDIGDATGDGTIAQTGYKQTFTSTLNTTGAVWTMTNTTADLTADVSFIDFKYTDDGDANGYFLRGYDNAGNDLKWSIGQDGLFTGSFSGAHNGTVGATTPAAGAFTTLTASTSLAVTADTTNGGYIRLMEGSSAGTGYSSITGAATVTGGYPAFTFSGSAGSEDMTLTASSNMWTFNSTTGAAFTFTPAVTVTGTLTANGAVNLGDGGDDIHIKLQKNVSDGTWNGITLSLTCAATTAFGQLVYIDSNGKAALADADAAATMPAVAICVVACANADDTGTFLTHGVISETDWNWTAGQTLYVSESAGSIENTVSNISDANDVVQVIGVALGADTILFNPSLTTVVVK